mgnify:CR=1 FL=1
MPVDELTVATPVFELFHVPPLVVPDHVAVEPTHNGVVPDNVWRVGAAMDTVLVAVLTQAPEVTLYEINAVPALTPVMTPEEVPIVATPEEALFHVPPLVVLVQAAVEPTHTGVVPVMVCVIGAEIVTVLVAVLTQAPEVTLYEINAVPALIPVTTPVEEPMVATPEEALVHVPPLVVLVHVAVEPTQTGFVPEMVCVAGAVTVIVLVPVLKQAPEVTL